MKINYLIISMLLCTLQLTAQQTFKVTKSLDKEYTFKPGDVLKITGERTFIFIESADTDKVSASVEVISRYSNEKQAAQDLDKIKVRFQKKGKTLYYSNGIIIDNPDSKPKSNLKTILKLTVPNFAKIEVSNSYGEMTITGDVANISSTSQFSKLTTTSFRGALEIDSKYGTIKCLETDATLKITGNRTDLSLSSIRGSVDAKLKYGLVDITYSDKITSLNIEAEHAPITLIVPDQMSNNLTVNCKNCDIDIDNCQNIFDEKIGDGNHTILLGKNRVGNSKGSIKSKKEIIKIITTTSTTTYNNN